MKKKFLTGLQDSGTNTQLTQVLSHLQIEPPANGDPMCQACGEAIVEGDPVTLYISRPVGHSSYTVSHCRCGDHAEELTSLFTLGVRELIVGGRIGQCRDHATQQTWPVLLAPSVRLLSAPDTTSGRVVSDTTDIHTTAPKQSRLTDIEAGISIPQATPSFPNRDTSIDTTEPNPAAGRGDNEC